MTEPKRIQLRRIKGWRKPEGAIVVARPTMFGNPFRIGAVVYVFRGDGAWQQLEIESRQHAADTFREWLADQDGLRVFPREHHQIRTLLAMNELRGHDLACWCPLDQPCHADVLLEVANG